MAYEWAFTFRVSACIMVFGALFYGALASGELQPWSQLFNLSNNNSYNNLQTAAPQQQPPQSAAASAPKYDSAGSHHEDGAPHHQDGEKEMGEEGDSDLKEPMQSVRSYGLPRAPGGPNATLPLLLPARNRLVSDYASLALSQAPR